MQSRGSATRAVGWVQSSAMLVRRDAAAEVGYLDPEFFVYSDETDFCKRLGDAGWRVLYVRGGARRSSRPALDRSGGPNPPHRGVPSDRDLYMRKHHSRLAAALVRGLTAWFYAVRAGLAPLLGGDSARWYLLHARQALRPDRGEESGRRRRPTTRRASDHWFFCERAALRAPVLVAGLRLVHLLGQAWAAATLAGDRPAPRLCAARAARRRPPTAAAGGPASRAPRG